LGRCVLLFHVACRCPTTLKPCISFLETGVLARDSGKDNKNKNREKGTEKYSFDPCSCLLLSGWEKRSALCPSAPLQSLHPQPLCNGGRHSDAFIKPMSAGHWFVRLYESPSQYQSFDQAHVNWLCDFISPYRARGKKKSPAI
jgi:hypothetical protein